MDNRRSSFPKEKEYYFMLPNEARFELLLQADIFVVLELCQEPIFKDICNSKLLWLEKSKREFGVEGDKQKYLKLVRMKLRQEIDKLENEAEDLRIESFYTVNKDKSIKILAQADKEANRLQKEWGINCLFQKQKEINNKIEILNQNIENANILYIKDWVEEEIRFIFVGGNKDIRGIIETMDKETREKYTIIIFSDFQVSEQARQDLGIDYKFLDNK